MIFMKDLKQITALYKLFSTMDKETARKRKSRSRTKSLRHLLTLQLHLHVTPPHSAAECTVMLGATYKDALGGQKTYGEQEIDISNSLRSKYQGHWLEL